MNTNLIQLVYEYNRCILFILNDFIWNQNLHYKKLLYVVLESYHTTNKKYIKNVKSIHASSVNHLLFYNNIHLVN